jgi:hypothetical protein
MQLRQVGESYRIQLCAHRGYTLQECANRIRPSALHVIINSTNNNKLKDIDITNSKAILEETKDKAIKYIPTKRYAYS